MKKGTFITLSVLAGIFVVGLFLFFYASSVQNKAIGLEEHVNESKSAINIQEKRRVDLILNLVDTVESYNKHEAGTLEKITQARTQAKSGNIDEAQVAINAVTEAYPELKADKNYDKLMTELSVTENLIAEHRQNYNTQVQAYNKHVRKFPNSALLNIMGYEKQDADYLKYEDAPETAPQNLFDREKK